MSKKSKSPTNSSPRLAAVAAPAPEIVTVAPSGAAPRNLSTEKGIPMKDVKEQFAAMTAAFTPANYDQFIGVTKEQVAKLSTNSLKTYEEVSKFSKENLDACVTAGTIVAKGFESIGQSWMNYSQDAVEAGAHAAKALLGAKTLREAADLQADVAKTLFGKLVAETTKMSETAVKLGNDVIEPLNARVNFAVEKLFKPIAA